MTSKWVQGTVSQIKQKGYILLKVSEKLELAIDVASKKMMENGFGFKYGMSPEKEAILQDTYRDKIICELLNPLPCMIAEHVSIDKWDMMPSGISGDDYD